MMLCQVIRYMKISSFQMIHMTFLEILKKENWR